MSALRCKGVTLTQATWARTVQDLPPKSQTLQHIRILFAVVVRQPGTTFPAPDGETVLGVLGLCRMEVLLQEANHTLTRIAVGSQEGVVVTNGIQTLSNVLLREAISLIARCKRFDGPFFAFDILLNIPPRAALRVDLLRGDRNKIVPEHVNDVVLLQDAVNRPDRLDTREAQELLDFWGLTVLKPSSTSEGHERNAI